MGTAALKPGDYEEWTEYSHGNPDCWRRLYNGRLLYVTPGHSGWTWFDPNTKPFKFYGPFETKAEAIKAAETWAEGLDEVGEQGIAAGDEPLPSPPRLG